MPQVLNGWVVLRAFIVIKLVHAQSSSVLHIQDCADVSYSYATIDLAKEADIIVTGVALAAGPGTGSCLEDGSLTWNLDNSSAPVMNFMVIGLQCVNKGMISCRGNQQDSNDCIILIEAPVVPDSLPCGISQGERYMFFLQNQTLGCLGYYSTTYERIYHSVRRPLGGAGCTYYPCYGAVDELPSLLATQCAEPVLCVGENDKCNPLISSSPCANDTSVQCTLKTCPGKYMYYNAILPNATCYEVYHYLTSGLPTNCYGPRYINNRVSQMQAAKSRAQQLQAMQATNPTTASDPSIASGAMQQSALSSEASGSGSQQPASALLPGAAGSSSTGQALNTGNLQNEMADLSSTLSGESTSSPTSANVLPVQSAQQQTQASNQLPYSTGLHGQAESPTRRPIQSSSFDVSGGKIANLVSDAGSLIDSLIKSATAAAPVLQAAHAGTQQQVQSSEYSNEPYMQDQHAAISNEPYMQGQSSTFTNEAKGAQYQDGSAGVPSAQRTSLNPLQDLLGMWGLGNSNPTEATQKKDDSLLSSSLQSLLSGYLQNRNG